MINKFEELKSWIVARELNNDIFSILSRDTFNKDFPLKDRLNRTAGSIIDNIAEGFGRNGRKEFIHFLSISKGSCLEFKSQLYRAHDRKHINKDEFNLIFDKTDHIEKMNSNLIKYLLKSKIPGAKFREC